MLESVNMARIMFRWPNRPSEMRHFPGFSLILIILNYSNMVNSLDIFVSQVGPESDFHEVTSGRLHVDEGRNKVYINTALQPEVSIQDPICSCNVSLKVTTALTAPWCGLSRLR